jgi:hypothetical protein
MIDPEKQRETELKEFHAALGQCITRWANVEKVLADVFELCLQRANFQLVAAAFYSIDNFRAKIGVVDSILSVALKSHRLLEEWNGKGALLQKLNAKSKIRNTIAHSMVIYVSAAKTGNRPYLRRTIFDPTMPLFFPRRPTHGYFTRDLVTISEQFLVLSDELRAFGSNLGKPIKRFLKSSEQEQNRLYRLAQESLNRAIREVRPQSSGE